MQLKNQLCLIEDLEIEKQKQYLNKNKILLVFVNHAFLGFYLCQSRINNT